MSESAQERPRVLLLGPLGPPHVEDQALALRDRGMDVRVGGNALRELDDTVIQDAGIPVSQAPDVTRSTPWGMAATVRWTRATLKALRPDVVNAHWVPGFGFAAAVAGARPLAITAWGSDVLVAGRAMKVANRIALRRADLVMADSRALLDACIELGADPERAEIVQWGVDLDRFYPASGDRSELKRKLGLGPGPVVLSARSFMPVYNIPTIIEAFARIGERLPDAQLVLKHMGAVRIDLPPFPHPERVRVIGKVSYEEMVDHYRAADVCVSLTSSDSSPRSVWEAMACGTPCVISDLPWVRELIDPGVQAITVPIDAEALGEAVIDVLTDAERAEALGRAGRELVESHLDRKLNMDRLAELCRGLVAAPAR